MTQYADQAPIKKKSWFWLFCGSISCVYSYRMGLAALTESLKISTAALVAVSKIMLINFTMIINRPGVTGAVL